MKTKYLYSDKAKGGLFLKGLLMSIIIALMAAFLPAPSVLAAPASGDPEIDLLEQEWNNKLSMVRAQNLFNAQVKLFPVDYKDSKDMARPYELLDKYGAALKKANEIILKHAGFDKTGDVIDEEDALKSVQDLSACLDIMYGMLAKLEEEGYPFHRLK